MPELSTAVEDARIRRGAEEVPSRTSSGYLIRDANRAMQRILDRRIAPFGISRGQLYFLRVLWTEDGISQSELSTRVGAMEPTTTVGLRRMEQAGLVSRVQSNEDKRKTHVWLTPKAKELRKKLLPVTRKLNEEAASGISQTELDVFIKVITRITENLDKQCQSKRV